MIYTSTFIDGFGVITGSSTVHWAQFITMIVGAFLMRDEPGELDYDALSTFYILLVIHVTIPVTNTLPSLFEGFNLLTTL